MNDRPPQSALRQWQAQMFARPTLGALLACGAVLGLAGPFGTDQLLSLPARLGYWLILVVLSYGTGLLVSLLVEQHLRQRKFWRSVLISGSLTAIGTAIFVLTLNLLVFDWYPEGAEWGVFLGSLFAITLIVTAAIQFVGDTLKDRSAPDTTPAVPIPPPILDRIALDKRGPLVALSVEDHYVRVRTSRGEELILMRLSDAMREVGDTPGAQVHRSHWAAFDQVTSVRREGDRAILTMSDASEVPVSRANLTKIREAGLLPR